LLWVNFSARPSDLLWNAGRLFISDSSNNNVSIFNPVTGNLDNPVGHPSQRMVRFGHVALSSPETPPSDCAALGMAFALCQGPGNSLMIGLQNGLVTIPWGLALRYPGEDSAPKPGPEPEESKNEAPAPTAPPPVAPPAGPRVRYTVDEPPPQRSPDAVILSDRKVGPDHSMELSVRSKIGDVYRWAWGVSAGSFEPLDTNRIRFTPPADAESGSTFRITARPAESTSNASPLPAHLDIVLP
jgi:hypothetical protein